MNLSFLSVHSRAVLIFLTFALIGPLLAGVICGLAGSSFVAPLINPQKVLDGTMFAYFLFLSLAFGAVPAIVSGAISALRFLKNGFFRARFAMLISFLSSGLVGPAYHYLYAGNKPTGNEITNSILVSYFAVGPIAILCGFLSQRAAVKLHLMSSGPIDAEYVE